MLEANPSAIFFPDTMYNTEQIVSAQPLYPYLYDGREYHMWEHKEEQLLA